MPSLAWLAREQISGVMAKRGDMHGESPAAKKGKDGNEGDTMEKMMVKIAECAAEKAATRVNEKAEEIMQRLLIQAERKAEEVALQVCGTRCQCFQHTTIVDGYDNCMRQIQVFANAFIGFPQRKADGNAPRKVGLGK